MRLGGLRNTLGPCVALVLLTQACGATVPSSSSLISPVAATRPPTATGIPVPTASASALNPEGYQVVRLSAAAVRTVSLPWNFRFHRIDSDGSLVVLDEMPLFTTTKARSIYVIDLQRGSTRVLSPPAPDGWLAWFPAISGHQVAWIDYRNEGSNDTGPLDWRIELADLTRHTSRTLASGIQRRSGTGFGASWPAMDLDGNRLAYAIEDPAHPPNGWEIRVVSVPTGAVERTVPTDLPVYGLAISGQDVAYSEGKIDPQEGFTYATRLFISRPTDPAPVQLASNAYEVAFEDGRLAWSQDEPTTLVSGAAHGTRIWTAALPELRPEPAAPPPGHGTEQYQAWPRTGSGFITWDSARLSVTDTSVNGDRFAVWDPHDRIAYELDPSPGAIISSAGGGWLVWVNERLEVPTISGIPIRQSGLP